MARRHRRRCTEPTLGERDRLSRLGGPAEANEKGSALRREVSGIVRGVASHARRADRRVEQRQSVRGSPARGHENRDVPFSAPDAPVLRPNARGELRERHSLVRLGGIDASELGQRQRERLVRHAS